MSNIQIARGFWDIFLAVESGHYINYKCTTLYYTDKILHGLFMKLSRSQSGQVAGLIIITIRLGEGELHDRDSLLPGTSIGRIISVDNLKFTRNLVILNFRSTRKYWVSELSKLKT